MRNLVAVLLVCSSVVSQSSAAPTIVTRELVGDPSAFSNDPVLLESGAESEFVVSTGSGSSTSTQATTAPVTLTLESASSPAPTELSDLDTTLLTPSPFLRSQVAGAIEEDPSVDVTSALTTDTEVTVSGSSSGAEPTAASLLKKTTATTFSSSSSSVSGVTARTSSSNGSGSSSSNGLKDINVKEGSDSGSNSSGNDDYESGSGSKRTYACACKDVRKVSLMGQSDYCLAKSANVAYKCGNTAVKENGVCPRVGAQPCSDTGHVLANDSICAFDDVDNVYKCVASTEDLEIKKNGGKRPKKKNSTAQNNATAADSIAKSGAASLHRSTSAAFHAITLVATLALGIAALL